MGDPTERGQLPIYAELQVPLNSGAHDALLVEMLGKEYHGRIGMFPLR